MLFMITKNDFVIQACIISLCDVSLGSPLSSNLNDSTTVTETEGFWATIAGSWCYSFISKAVSN